jgi:farnesyl-diphosphate farnesyltransferase
MGGVGEGDERRLLEEFPKCHAVFAAFAGPTKVVIKDITARMAEGMAEFIGKDLGQGTRDTAEYNRYCHFVAGLVGEGLSRLFACSGLEQKSMAAQVYLSDQMGLFLQVSGGERSGERSGERGGRMSGRAHLLRSIRSRALASLACARFVRI